MNQGITERGISSEQGTKLHEITMKSILHGKLESRADSFRSSSVSQVAETEHDPNSGLASPNHTAANLPGLVRCRLYRNRLR